MKRIEVVEWLDHCAFDDGTWHDVDACVENLVPYPVTSIGEIVHETPKHLVIVPHRADNDKTTGALCIIKGNITSRHRLASPRKRRKK